MNGSTAAGQVTVAPFSTLTCPMAATSSATLTFNDDPAHSRVWTELLAGSTLHSGGRRYLSLK